MSQRTRTGLLLGHTLVSTDPYLRPSWRTLSYFFPTGEDEGGDEGTAVSLRAQLAALKAKHGGDADRVIEELHEVNGRLAAKVTRLTAERDAAKALIPEGGRAITKEEADELEAYRKVGKPTEVVPKGKLDEAEGRLAEVDARTLHDTAAKALGWKGNVLHELVRAKALHVELKDDVVDGKAVKRPYVRPKADERATPVLLHEYARANLADFLPALSSSERIMPDQQSAGGGGGGSSVGDRWQQQQREAQKGVTNPLQPAAAATT
jgi:hypothetical protein